MALNLNKIANEAPELHGLAEKTALSLEKRNMADLTASVALVLDYSLSMSALYQSGQVQALAQKVLAVATQLDDDGEIDIYLFETKSHYVGTLNLANFRDGIKALTKGVKMGSTDYAGVINLVVKRSTGKKGLFKKAALTNPTLALFVTDGVPNSQKDAEDALIAASFHPVFWQFLSLGGTIPFLQKLDDLQGRDVDNADYKPIRSVNDLTDDALLNMILDEYPSWVQEQKDRGSIK